MDGDFVLLFEGYENKSSIVHNIGDKFLVKTDIDAPKYRLVEVDTKNPWKRKLERYHS